MTGRDPSSGPAALPSFMKSLFCGVVADDLVFPYPEPRPVEAETLETYLGDLRRFLDAKVDGATFDREAEVPAGVLDGLAELGVLGLTVPTRYGGLGFSHRQAAPVLGEIAARDGGLAVVVGAHLSLGIGGILLHGTDAQKERWIPPCARGETPAAFALTEPGHGSDAAHVESRAVRSGDGWLLNGHKIWIGNAHHRGLITAFAQTPVERGEETVDRVTAFVVEGADEGLEIGRLWTDGKLGIRSSTQAELFFRDLRLDDDRVLGAPGEGFDVAMNVLNRGRLSAASFAVGGTRRILEEAAAFAVGRRQFGRPIADFDLIREKLARIETEAWIAESTVWLTADLVDRGGVDFSLESAICKVWSSEVAWRAADAALQVAGGRGYMADRPFERFLRDARVLPIFEGTNEILRLFVALAGIKDLAEWLEGVGDALRDPIRGLGVLTDFAFHRIRDAVGSPEVHVEAPEPLAGPLGHFARLSGLLHTAAADLVRAKREAVVEEQLQLARLADMAIDLYGLVAGIARAAAAIERDGEQGAAREIDLVRQFSREAGARIEHSRALFDENRDARTRRIAGRVVAGRRGALA